MSSLVPRAATAAPGAGRPQTTRVGRNRFPAAPAQDALRGFARAHAVRVDDLGAVLGIDHRLVTSVMGRRWLPWHLADVIAVALRRHPYDLWPEWFPGYSTPTDTRPNICDLSDDERGRRP